MKRNITIEQPTPHVAVVRTIEGRRREAKYAKVDLALRVDVSFDLKDLRALPGVPQDPEALACWLEDQREDLLEALNDEALKLLQEFAEEETATDIDARVRELESEDDTDGPYPDRHAAAVDRMAKAEPRVSTRLAMSPAGEWWTVTMHDGEPHSAQHHSGAQWRPVFRDTFVRWGSDDPIEVLEAVTKLWRPT